MSTDPNLESVEGVRLHSKMHLCKWHNITDEITHLVNSIRGGKTNTAPFPLLGCSDDPALQLQCARNFIEHEIPSRPKLPQGDAPWRHERLRIAYLSADFREHAVSLLLADVFDQHDRSRFETFAISWGRDKPDNMRLRLERAFSRFIDAEGMDDQDISHLLRKIQTDIAVDLMGFTRGARPNIFALRPAPIQVNYLGYPGTIEMRIIWTILSRIDL